MIDKRVALIIASYQYKDTGLRQLVTLSQEAEALTRVLANPNIGSFEVHTLRNVPSFRVNRAIEAFFADRRRDDLLLLYFTGHGIKDASGQLYFATIDTQIKLLRSTSISASWINNIMRHSHSRRQVILLDCCYSGTFPRGMVAKADQVIGTQEYFREGRGRVIVTASDVMQYSFEGNRVEGKGVCSVFTRTLVHGLETGKADLDGSGFISLDELYDFIYDRVTEETSQQKPVKWNFGIEEEIIIAQNPKLGTGEQRSEQGKLPSRQEKQNEAYAIARIKDHQPGWPFYTRRKYVLQTGIQCGISEGFEGVGISLPSREDTIEFEIVVHAEDMNVEPAWIQSYTFNRNEKPSLLEFVLNPTKSGYKQICVEFYYRRHWLAQVQFEVEVVKVQERIPA